MLGIQQEQKDMFSYNVDLDRRVRQDNILRRIKEQISFEWVRGMVARFYGYNGNESVDPVVIVKMMLLLFLDNVRSERELMRIIPERLDYLWFLGYNLDERIPDHSVLSKARARWGREVFEELFVRTVWECARLGLVDGKKIHVDASFVDANASATKNILNGPPELIAALKAAYGVEEEKLDEPERPGGPQPKNKTAVSLTDPDAPLAAHDKGGARPRHKHHRVVDDRRGVITAVATTPGTVHESHCLQALTQQHEQNTGLKVQTVVADTQYGTRENFRALQAEGKQTHMGVSRIRGTAKAKNIFHVSEFAYDAQTDTYRCPAGQTLTRRGYNKNVKGWYYRAGIKVCGQCPLKDKCYKSPWPGYTRTISRPQGADLIDEGYRQAQSWEGRRDRRRRQTLMEGSFGCAAQNHGFKRARWRRLWRQQIQDYLIAAVQNIKIILKHARQSVPAATMAAVAPVLIRLNAICAACFVLIEDATTNHQLRKQLRAKFSAGKIIHPKAVFLFNAPFGQQPRFE
jgi:transposase